jgi:hypothetical protein
VNLAIESFRIQVSERYFDSFRYANLPQLLLDSMDFRRTAELLSFAGVFKEELKNDLHAVYDSRNKYVHIQTLKILGKKRDDEIQQVSPQGVPLRIEIIGDDRWMTLIQDVSKKRIT